MRVLCATTLTLAGQLLLGVALYSSVAWLLARRRARRRWRGTWAAGARLLRRSTSYFALLMLVGGGLAALSPFGIRGAVGSVWARPAWFVVLGAIPAASAWTMLYAARLEARGRLRVSRRLARLGGQLLFVGSFAVLVLVWSGLLFDVALRRALVVETAGAGLVLLGAMLALGCCAFISLTAGLAGKPRPSAHVAAALYVTGVAALITAYQLTL